MYYSRDISKNLEAAFSSKAPSLERRPKKGVGGAGRETPGNRAARPNAGVGGPKNLETYIIGIDLFVNSLVDSSSNHSSSGNGTGLSIVNNDRGRSSPRNRNSKIDSWATSSRNRGNDRSRGDNLRGKTITGRRNNLSSRSGLRTRGNRVFGLRNSDRGG